ncbi:hypothetical protein KSP40_PGU001938 [Platanthera guangdongensis]|uniref:Aldehyde dehydrogenase domain-containing protein n=1 Tax=Platanthera guangdongensis TaxID=2320717 RepID=A0ABR2LDX5_9ASPA
MASPRWRLHWRFATLVLPHETKQVNTSVGEFLESTLMHSCTADVCKDLGLRSILNQSLRGNHTGSSMLDSSDMKVETVEKMGYEVAINRIARAKWGFCSGQDCIAIDYLLVEEKYAPFLVDLLKEKIKKCYMRPGHLTRIVNKKHKLGFPSKNKRGELDIGESVLANSARPQQKGGESGPWTSLKGGRSRQNASPPALFYLGKFDDFGPPEDLHAAELQMATKGVKNGKEAGQRHAIVELLRLKNSEQSSPI